MVGPESSSELKGRLSTISPAKREWLEQRVLTSLKNGPIGRERAKVVQLQVGSNELPVYFIYAGPDEIRIAQMMGVDHSIFGIDVPWPLSWRDAALNNDASALPTTEQLVAPFVAALSAHVRSSPCVLAGYSFAGIMAFEAAHQLQRLGGKVELVMLLDSPGKRPRPLYAVWHKLHAVWHRLRQRWKQTLDEEWAERSGDLIGFHLRSAGFMFWWILTKATKKIIRLVMPPSSKVSVITSFIDEQNNPLPWELVARLYEKAQNTYNFRVLDSHGVFFASQTQEGRRTYNSSLGWEDLFAKGLEVISVMGDHQTMLRQESHRLTLAKKMTEVLRRYSMSKGNTLGV